MAVKSLLRSFAGGEITPEMFGRVDLGKFQTGVQRARNMIVLPHGPLARRPGTRFGAEAKDSTQTVRVVPFVFSADQAVMLEFGAGYIRFHTAGGTVLEAGQSVTGLTAANPGVFQVVGHGLSNGQWIYLTGIGGPVELNGRFFVVANVTVDTFTLKRLDGSAVDTTLTPWMGGGTVARVYEVATPYAAADLMKIRVAQSADVMTLTHPSYAARELRRLGATNWQMQLVSFTPTLGVPGGVSATATVGVASNLTPQHYKVTAVAADLVTESLPSVDVTCTNNLTLAGNYNTIAWGAVATAARYFVYKLRGGIYGFIGQTTGLNLVDDNILADTSISPPEANITLNTGAGDYPTTVTYYEQRRWFAGTINQPQTIWATRNATESNLTASVPSRADDALRFRVASQQQNAVRHLLPLGDLLALTAAGEWRIFADGAPAIAPDSLSVKPQGYSGSSDTQPALTSSSILYVQAQGSRIRELSSGGESSNYGYRSVDISIMAPHLFNGYTVVDMAYARAPDQVLWCVRSDGALLGMSYVPEQQVYGWHGHDTGGFFESCAVIPEGGEDVLYLVVRRVVAGRTVRYIERMASRLFVALADAYYVDSGLTYSGAPTLTLSGLWHLEGKAVSVLADGAVVGGRVVSNGSITLDSAASKVHVGLPFTSDVATLPLALEMQAAGQGTQKNINAVHVRVTQSSLLKAGPVFDKLREYPARAVSDPYGSPPALRSGELKVSIDPSWNTDGSICIRQDEPLPLTVASMTLELAVGG